MKKKIVTVALSAAVAVAACAGMVTLVHSGNLGKTSTVPTAVSTEEPATVAENNAGENSAKGENVTETIGKIVETVTSVVHVEPDGDSQKPGTSVKIIYVEQDVTLKDNDNAATTGRTGTTKAATTKPETTKSIEQVAKEDDLNLGQATVITSSGDLPKDMTLAGLYKQGYDTFGRKKYIYNNDKDCAQSAFGYNRFYDKAAGLLDFHIDTCRMKINDYDGRDWMIQFWKGTYITGDIGTVGCEIGLYNRKHGKSGGLVDHYACAEEPDWLPMEMTLLWDENYDGNFKAQFTRNYTYYWWPTGFVDGQLRNVKDTTCLRVLGRITFKDNVMADKFAESLANVGFSEVSTFNLRKDTFKQYLCDVIFCWQDARD